MTAVDDDPKTTRKKKAQRWIAGGLAGVVLAGLGYELYGLRALTRADELPPINGNNLTAPSSERPRVPDLDAGGSAAATYSNIYKYDYVGPETCAKCHGRNYELWKNHPHSKMNRNATAGSVVGDFSGGGGLDYGGGRAVFSRLRGEFTMNLFRGDKFVRQLKVTRVIGSRFVQMYIGLQTEGPEPREDPVYTTESKLPFAYWISRKEWFPETYDETKATSEYDAKTGELTTDYAFLSKPRTRSWQQVCIKCHNTYPYASRFNVAPAGKLLGFPPSDVKRTTSAIPTDPVAKSGLADLEAFELVTMGISCESCHFGGREHALSGAPISFVPRSPDLDFPKATPALIANGRHEPYVINSICRQCHTADPQGPIYPNGAASWNSREARDLEVGSCASKIACTNCHNPHEAGPVVAAGASTSTSTSTLDREPQHIAACVSCHEQYRSPEARAKHGAHASNVKVNCLDCHMPKIVHGLSGTIRSHRISSPTDPRMLQDEYPNACNLCHLDRSTRWTLDALATKWNRKVDLHDPIPGGADEPIGPRWLSHRESVVRQAAAAAYARSGSLGKPASLRTVIAILNDDSPPARMFGMLAVEEILGRRITPSEYTPWAPPAQRQAQIAALLARP